MLPAPELHLRAGQRVVAFDDRGVEGRHQRRVKKIEQVGDRWPEPLDLQAIDRVDMANNFLGRVATRTGVEQVTERPLVLRVFVDIGYAELRFPEKGVVGAFENLTLLCDGMNDRFERRSPVGDAERAALDLTNDLAQIG